MINNHYCYKILKIELFLSMYESGRERFISGNILNEVSSIDLSTLHQPAENLRRNLIFSYHYATACP